MKKLFNVVLVLILLLNSSGCAVKEAIENEIDNQQKAIDTSNKIIQYLNDNQVEELEKLFSEYEQNQQGFKHNVKEFFGYFDEKIVSFDIDYRGETSLYIRDGIIAEQAIKTVIDIVTESKRVYKIIFESYTIFVDDKTKEGMIMLQLRDEDDNILAVVG